MVSDQLTKFLYRYILSLICHLLNWLDIKLFKSSLLILVDSWSVHVSSRKCSQISLLVSLLNSSYFNMTWILLRIASSNLNAWFVVRNKILSKYLNLWRKTVTRSFCCSFLKKWCFMNTSALFNKRSVFQWWMILKMWKKHFLSSPAFMINSPAKIWKVRMWKNWTHKQNQKKKEKKIRRFY